MSVVWYRLNKKSEWEHDCILFSIYESGDKEIEIISKVWYDYEGGADDSECVGAFFEFLIFSDIKKNVANIRFSQIS